jgi:hypothetical protein
MDGQLLLQKNAGKLSPLKPVGSRPVNFDAQTMECAKLRDIMQENTGLPSICPFYSKAQLHRIERLRVGRYKNGQGYGNIRRSSLNKTDVSSGYRLANNVEALL